MKTTAAFRMLISMLMLCFALTLSAQSRGDQLYQEGQKLQKVMTVSSQNSAIKKFQAAKVVFTTAEKKKMCDDQVAVCNSNIKTIKAKNSAPKEEPQPTKVEEPVKKAAQPKPVPVEVKLVVTPATIEFPCTPKGKSKTITIESNVEWRITSAPEWVEIFTSDGKCNVVAATNDSGEKRSGAITIQAGNKQAIVVVNQKITLAKKVKKALDI